METQAVFVSHSSTDDAFCRKLVLALRGQGADVWYDEHNLGSGHLLDVIQRELERRPIFIVILSKAAFASPWVRDECVWAHGLLRREPQRMILPVTAGDIAPADFSGTTGWLFLESFRRIEAPGYKAFPEDEAVRRTLSALGYGSAAPAAASESRVAPAPASATSDSATGWSANLLAVLAAKKYSEAYDLAKKVLDAKQGDFDWADVIGAFYAGGYSSYGGLLLDKISQAHRS